MQRNLCFFLRNINREHRSVVVRYTDSKIEEEVMIFKNIQSNIEIIDSDFDQIYPNKIKKIADIHFTPIQVSKTAAQYLADREGVKILDVGSGAGKFCMIGSACTEGHFIGVEQRKGLCTVAKRITRKYKLTNVEFIHSNITDISFKEFDAFYFFNSFYENISIFANKIDDEITLNRDLYPLYSAYVKEQLDSMPIGTKLVTYFSFLKEIPDSYKVKFTKFDEKLKMWEKVS